MYHARPKQPGNDLGGYRGKYQWPTCRVWLRRFSKPGRGHDLGKHGTRPNSEHIGMIRIDPRDSNVVYVAAQGPLWSAGGERGLYKSTDGGATWNKLLGDGLGNNEVDDQYTGVSEVHLDPRDPDVVYAVSWQRFRNVAVLMDGGPGSGIHKSTDGGATWRKLTEGLPDEDMGKVGFAVSPQNPDVVYATIELAHKKGGFYRSENGGESWEKQNDYLSGGTGPHYYQEIFADPSPFRPRLPDGRAPARHSRRRQEFRNDGAQKRSM